MRHVCLRWSALLVACTWLFNPFSQSTKSRHVAIGLILNYYRPDIRTVGHTDGGILLWRCEDTSKKAISSSMRIVLLNGWYDCDHPCRIWVLDNAMINFTGSVGLHLDSLKYMPSWISFTMNSTMQEMDPKLSDFIKYYTEIIQNTTDDLNVFTVPKKWKFKFVRTNLQKKL